MSQSGILNSTSTTPSNVPINFVTDSGTAVAAANIINVNGGTNVTTSGAGNTILIDVTGTSGVTWPSVARGE